MYNALKCVYFAITCVVMTACSNKVDLSWKEEVLLSNGKTIQVERRAVGTKNYELGGSGWTKYDGMTVSFHGLELDDSYIEFSSNLIPIILDYDPLAKEYFVVAALYTCEDWREHGKREIPYVLYTFRSGAWRIHDVGENLVGRKANLLAFPGDSMKTNFISTNEKEKRNAGVDRYYLEIVGAKASAC